ncbi:MAG: NAD(P)-dependent glycerol-3-phosphate dehydrogenase [Burkholderiaceae bacterium]|nr:MAG: NAD(P)-dependent glycerol-3-phosphate dehydrogenase [Burkholderiaceae bacterium]
MRIIVIGAGAWGTALAVNAARSPAAHDVVLWARDRAQAEAMDATRENARYLPGIPLPHTLKLRSGAPAELLAAVPQADLLVIATPVAGLRATLTLVRDAQMPVAWLCKGFEAVAEGGRAAAAGLLPHEVQQAVAPHLHAGALSGPSFAQEVARGQPTAIVAASRDAAVHHALVAAFHGPTLRVYVNDDLIGVEVGGAVKNVLAIAAGLADGMKLGLNARAALITRGLAEMARFGVALGAQERTFMGLSGMGDLVLTATGDLSRNRRVGFLLAGGESLGQVLASLGHVAEGAYSAHTVVQRARLAGVEMPISECVLALLEGHLRPVEALVALMGRDPKGEML